MSKTLLALGSILLMFSTAAMAGQASDTDWGRVKTLYGGQPGEIEFDRGGWGTLTPVEPTLTSPEDRALFIYDMLLLARDQRPDLEIWKDPEIIDLLDSGERGATNWIKKIFGWVLEHVQFSTSPSGFNFYIRWDNGCFGLWRNWDQGWGFGPCV